MVNNKQNFYVSYRTGFPTTNLEPGAICYLYDTQEVYLHNDNNWVKLTSLTNNPRPERKHPRICTQCGSPLHGYKCEYCDTEYM